MLISVDSRTYLLSKINKLRKERKFFKIGKLDEKVILSEKSGPQKFLSDLITIIEKNNLAKITFNIFSSDIHLINSGYYSPFWNYYQPKRKEKVILRLDGIGIDTPNINQDKIRNNLLGLINKSSLLIFQSQFCKNCFLDLFPSLPQGEVIINGAKEINNKSKYGMDLFKLINNQFKGSFFCVAGRFSSRKRIKEVIQQFNDSEIGNLVVLSDVPHKLRFKNPRIIYLGMIDPDAARLIISKSIALIHFDRYDWCPNLVIGAIYDQTPVICSNFGGTPEITGKNGLILKEFPENIPQTKEGIEFVKKANFPERIFKEAIAEINAKGFNLDFYKPYKLDETANEYVRVAKKLSSYKN